MNSQPYHVVMPAAGTGTRFGGSVKKQFHEWDGVPLVLRTARIFLLDQCLKNLVVCVAREDIESTRQILIGDDRVHVIAGGSTRAHSVREGVRFLQNAADGELVLVHDAVRSFVNTGVINRVLLAIADQAAAVPALAVTDTIKRIDDNNRVIETPQRLSLRAVQTPQGFTLGMLRSAYSQKGEALDTYTDEAMLVEDCGFSVVCVEGDEQNKKITTQHDLERGERVMQSSMRIGVGYDVHRLVEGKPCRIGGVEFKHDKGLLGHSDADVLLHAVADALLGACALGDIGQHFPDSDPRWQGADSVKLLRHCFELVREKGYQIGNVDTVVVCENPKIGPRREEIRAVLAQTLDTSIDNISVKATTEEKMGFTGAEEGIAAWAYAVLVRCA